MTKKNNNAVLYANDDNCTVAQGFDAEMQLNSLNIGLRDRQQVQHQL